jgi:hypothetical protein
MSKLDAQRAMREARYAERNSPATPAATTTRAAKPAAKRARAEKHPVGVEVPQSSADPSPQEDLCGHRAISGRTCTREQGHAAKSHRYS